MRKIALGLALSSVLASNSHAVGLGEIVTNSSLNQPLNASIELVDTSPGDIDDLEVTLAPSAVFDQVGIARSSALDKLEFIPTMENGVPTIKVTSLQPIQEPFLNFVLEVTWANGKLLREYTVLLDPPVFSDTQYADSGVTAEPVVEELPVATTVDDLAVATPEPMVAPVVAGEGLDPFVSIPDQSMATVGDIASVDDGENYQGLETYPVEGDISEPVSVEEAVVTSDLPVDTTGLGEGLDPFVGGAPVEVADIQDYSDAQAAPVDEISYDDYPIEESLPVEDVVMEVEPGDLSSDEIFVAESDSIPLEGTDDIFVADASPVVSSSDGVDSYKVQRGDTLSSIARKFASGSSVNQMMVAMARNNSGAFINSNMNLIKSGYVLRVPDATEAAGIPESEALAEIARSNAAWGQYRTQVASNPLPQLDSERLAGIEDLVGLDRGDVASAPEVDVVVETGEGVAEIKDLVQADSGLEIVVPDAGGDSIEGKANAAAGSIGNVEKELALAKEKLVSSTNENSELRSRVSELESLLASKNRLIELKNEQLAELQEQMEEVAPASDDSGAMETEKLTSEVAKAADNASDTAKGLLPRVEETEDTASATETPTNDEATSGETTLTEPPSKETKPEASGELLDDVKNNPNLLMGLGFGGLLLAALGWLVLRRKESDYEPPEVATPVAPEGADEGVISASATELVEDRQEPGDVLESVDTLTEPSVDDSSEVSEAVSIDAENELPESSFDEVETSAGGEDAEDEVLSEANVYLAYGLEDQAIEVLEPAVKAHPDRLDYAEKLLEAYHSTKNAEAFESLAENVATKIEDKDDSGLWKKIAVMGKGLIPGAALFASVDTGDLSMTQIRTRPPEIADIEINSDEDDVEESLLNTVSEMDTNEVSAPTIVSSEPSEEPLPELGEEIQGSADEEESIEGNQVAEIDASELKGLGEDFGSDFDSDLDLENDEVIDKLQNTQIELEEPSLDDLGDIELDTKGLELDDLKLAGEETLLNAPEATEPAKDDATISIPMEDRLNLDSLVSDEGAEGLFSTGEDEISTKLDLAKAYLDMGDDEGAREALEEVISLGTSAQRDEAEKLKSQLD
ncbi:MAG: FimV/HubP family polar landmark protein [bacterium]